EGDKVIGARTRVKIVKNKLSPPFQQTEFDIIFDEGISQSGEIVDLASELDIIDKSGAWYSYGSERIGQGRENAKSYLREHRDLMESIRNKVLEKMGV